MGQSKHDALEPKPRGSSGAEQTTNDIKGSDKNRELECENDVYYRKICTSCESDESDEDPNYVNKLVPMDRSR